MKIWNPFAKSVPVTVTPPPAPASPVPLGDNTRARLLKYCELLGTRAVYHDATATDARTHGRPNDNVLHLTLAEKTRAVITELSDILAAK